MTTLGPCFVRASGRLAASLGRALLSSARPRLAAKRRRPPARRSASVGDLLAAGGAGGGGGCRRRGGGALLDGLLAGDEAAARAGLALLDDAQEVVLQRRRRVADGVHLAAVLAHHLFEVAPQRVGQLQTAGPHLDAVGVLEQFLHGAVGL